MYYWHTFEIWSVFLPSKHLGLHCNCPLASVTDTKGPLFSSAIQYHRRNSSFPAVSCLFRKYALYCMPLLYCSSPFLCGITYLSALLKALNIGLSFNLFSGRVFCALSTCMSEQKYNLFFCVPTSPGRSISSALLSTCLSCRSITSAYCVPTCPGRSIKPLLIVCLPALAEVYPLLSRLPACPGKKLSTTVPVLS